MNGHPLSRCAASPLKGDGALCCGAALAGRPADCGAPTGCAADRLGTLELHDE